MTNADDEAPIGWLTLFRGAYAVPTWTLGLGVGLHALNAFMVATIMPSAVRDIGGLALISWASSVFLVASIVTGASGGWLKGAFGGRRVFLVSTLLLIAGSLIAALAPSMPVLLIGRALQGIGEGAVLALCYALVGEVYPSRAMPRAFGLLSIVYAAAALIGPAGAGLLAEHASWRIAFLANLPLGLIFVLLVLAGPASTPRAGGRRIPPLGRLTAIAGGVMAISMAGRAGDALLTAGWLAIAVAALAGSVIVDRRQNSRLFPLAAFGLSGAVGLGFWAALLMALATGGITVYVPLFMQEFQGLTPLEAGYVVVLLSLAWSGAAFLVASLRSERADPLLIAGPALIAVGMFILAPTIVGSSVVLPALALIVAGTGFGISWAFLSQRLLDATPAAERDLTAGAIPTLENAGWALGAAVSGMIASLAGLEEQLEPVVAARAAQAVFYAGAVIALLSLGAALGFVRLTRTRR
ncbi:MFS transporter [Oceanibacterium hippocampi]|uniref:Putative multidrug-efflux transporter/MT1670 n=1 Tax=Oceanibacterium hippocampi TaxID=745714 RepID=A0A1Y5SAD1_9PROT|nr:MFS transporter [Oceanibacterium hippocampi]SLN35422.1 putative multidrug-efflux transporter/MT1670 [Oceanibacterium hippocampi]